jgi:hypothetical protein
MGPQLKTEALASNLVALHIPTPQSLLVREYCMTNRGPTIRLLSPSPYSQVSKLDLQHTGRLRKRGNLFKGEGEGGG